MSNKLYATFSAFIFALGGIIPWIILGYFGWVSSLAGYLIGLAAFKGYSRVSDEYSNYAKAVIAIIIIVMIPFAEIVLIFIEAIKYYNVLNSIIFSFLGFFLSIADYAPSLIIGYLMAGLGTYQFFTAKTNSL